MKASRLRSLFPKDASGQWYANPALVIYLVNNAEAIAELIEAADSYANSTPCSDPDCCDVAIEHEAKRRATLSALAKIKE